LGVGASLPVGSRLAARTSILCEVIIDRLPPAVPFYNKHSRLQYAFESFELALNRRGMLNPFC